MIAFSPTTLLIAAGAVAVATSKKSGSKKSSRKGGYGFGTKSKPDREAVKRFIIDASRFVSGKYDTMAGLDDFLLGVAYGESRFNPFVQNGTSRNSARGLFQLRADSAFRNNNGLAKYRSRPDLLLNPYWNFVAAVDYAARGIQVANSKGGDPDWLAIRRWWAYPHLVHDYDESEARSRKVRDKFPSDLRKAGVSPNDAFKKARYGGYPGVYPIGKDFGLWS